MIVAGDTMSGDPWAEYDQIALADSTGLSAARLRLLAIGSLRTEVNKEGSTSTSSTRQAI